MLSAFLSAILLSASPPVHATPPPAAAVEVTVTGARSTEGQIVVFLFASSDGFPSDPARAAYTATSSIQGGRATLRVPNAAAGRYSIVAFHDADGNGRIKQNLIGMPREGAGMTRYEGGRPRFDRTAVDVPAAGARFTIGLTYR